MPLKQSKSDVQAANQIGPAFAASAGNIAAKLTSILAELRTSVEQLAVGNMEQQQLVLEEFPVARSRRVIARRTGNGVDNLAVTAGFPATHVIESNAARLGGAIVNSGSAAVVLYLAHKGDLLTNGEGWPAIWLAAAGGSWDFRLGNVMWCGSVAAAAATGGSVLTVAEV